MVRRLAQFLLGLSVLLSVLAVPAHADAASSTWIYVAWAEPQRDLITDPAYSGSWIWVMAGDWDPNNPSADIATSWTLQDASGATVLGPVSVPANARTFFTVGENAAGERSGTRLSAGDYTVVVTKTDNATGEVIAGSLPVTYVDDPPSQPVPGPTSVVNAIRDNDATWAVPSLSGRFIADAHLQVRNAAGRLVFEDTAPIDRGGPVNPPFASSPPLGTGYHLAWDGSSSTDVATPAGIYRASVSMPDQYGRPVDVPLGTVRLFERVDRTATSTRRLARPIVLRRGTTTLRLTAPRLPADARLTSFSVTSRMRLLHWPERRYGTAFPTASLTAAFDGGATLRPTLAEPLGGICRSRERTWGFDGRPLPKQPTPVDITITDRTRVPLRISTVAVHLGYWRWSLR